MTRLERVRTLRRAARFLHASAASGKQDPATAATLEVLGDQLLAVTFAEGGIGPEEEAYLLEHFGQEPFDENERA